MFGFVIILLLTMQVCQGNGSIFLCGINGTYMKYDTRTHHCSNNSVYPIIEFASLQCRTNRQKLLPTGFGCCNDVSYRPEVQTCCSQSGIFKIFNVPESNHTCCNGFVGFSVHLRGSENIKCQNTSTNDKFFTNVEVFKSSNISRDDVIRICKEGRLVFRIKLEKGGRSKNKERLHYAKLWAWSLPPLVLKAKMSRLKPPNGSSRIEIPLSKSLLTEDSLQGRQYLVLTNFDYFSQDVFFLNPDEHLYKFPKTVRSLRKRFRRLRKICLN